MCEETLTIAFILKNLLFANTFNIYCFIQNKPKKKSKKNIFSETDETGDTRWLKLKK